MAPRARSRSSGTSNAGRVIAGSARGVRLVGPGEGTRPIGDRVKQTLFAILEPQIRDRPFLDLYAGSGAAGIEAISRGASKAVFVESDRTAIRAIEQNLDAAGFERTTGVVVDASVSGWLARQTGLARRSPREDEGPFAAVLVDPPYDAPVELDWAIEGLATAGPDILVASDGMVVAKHFWKERPVANRLLRSVREERFGETMLTFYRWADDPASDEVAP